MLALCQIQNALKVSKAVWVPPHHPPPPPPPSVPLQENLAGTYVSSNTYIGAHAKRKKTETKTNNGTMSVVSNSCTTVHRAVANIAGIVKWQSAKFTKRNLWCVCAYIRTLKCVLLAFTVYGETVLIILVHHQLGVLAATTKGQWSR